MARGLYTKRGGLEAAAGLVVVCWASLAAAQDGGTFATGPFVAQPLVYLTVDLTSSQFVKPVWVDSQRRLIAIPGSGPPTPACYTFANDELRPQPTVPTLVNPNPNGAPQYVIGARPGLDTFLVVQVDGALFRAGCGMASVALGNYLPPAGLAPPAIGSLGDYTLPVDSSGAMHYAVAGGLAKLSITPAFEATLVTPIADLRTLVGLGPPANSQDRLVLSGLVLTPADDLVFLATNYTAPTTGAGRDLHSWILRRAASGALSIVWASIGSKSVASVAYEPATDQIFIDGLAVAVGPAAMFRTLAVLPPAPPSRLASQLLPFALRPTFRASNVGAETPRVLDRLVGGSSGVFASAETILYSFTVDPAVADFDRDGLRATQEAALGTSDYLADSDGDGVDDHWELTQTLTNPTDAGSVVQPPPFVDSVVLATSLAANIWRIPYGVPEDSWAPIMCGNDGCADSSLKKVPHTSGGGGYRFPLPPDGQPVTVTHYFDGTNYVSRSLVTGAEAAFLSPYQFSQGIRYVPIDATTALMTDGAAQLWRLTSADASGPVAPFAVIDVSRRGCEILDGPAALPRCGVDRTLSTPDISAIVFMGFDPRLRMVLVRVQTADAQFLLGVDATGAVRLANLTTSTEGIAVDAIIPMAYGGAPGYVVGTSTSTLRFDDLFRRVASTQPYLGRFVTPGMGIFFKHGFLEHQGAAYLIEPVPPGQGACGQTGGIFTCDDTPPQMPHIEQRQWVTEVIPIGKTLEKGDVLYWSAKRYRIVTVNVLDPLLGEYVDPGQPDWIVWRTTALGATTEWLRAPQFLARLDGAGQAELGATPLGPVTGIGISADGQKVCFAERAANRIWEFAADRITLVTKTAGAGCAYDETGTVATLGGSPTVIRIGAKSLPVPSVTAPLGLYRIDGHWIVQADHANAACVDDAGTVTDPGVFATALSSAPGGLAYIDNSGKGFTNTTARFCSGAPPAERLTSAPVNVWTTVNTYFTFRSTNAWSGVMAVRPDGVVLVCMDELELNGVPAGNIQVIPNPVYYFFPSYEVMNLAMPEHDAFRVTPQTVDLIAIQPDEVTAMAVVPGAPANRDWGYLKRPGNPVVTPPEPDAGTAEPPPPGTPPKKGCGCDGAGTSAPALLAWALGICAGRRRRTRG